jgi:two-component system LytT family response regulator
MNLLIVEDENLAARKIRKMAEELDPQINIAGMTDCIESTVDWLRKNDAPDLILMDIELADGQCFEIFNQVKVTSPIIFTTAYDEHAIRAFKHNSIDYLLKPVNAEDLRIAYEKFVSLRQTTPASFDLTSLVNALRNDNQGGFKKRFLIKHGQKLVPIETGAIAYFYTEDKVSFLKTFQDQRYMVDHSLDELEKMLDPKSFFRANRQFIICPASLDGIHHHFNGKLKVVLKPNTGDEVFVSRERAGDFKIWLGE